MLVCSMVGTLASLLTGVFNPRVSSKAGADWLWLGGRDDVIRNLYFKPNGTFRRYGRLGLFLTLTVGTITFAWVLHPLM